MKRHWLCNDVQGLPQCDNCLRNPERQDNLMAALEVGQQWRKPMASERGCADQMATAPAGSVRRLGNV